MSGVDEHFVIGQRVVNEAEPDLGLGIVSGIPDGRSVEISFPACEEMRVYRVQSAPLRRVALKVGHEAVRRDGYVIRVEKILEQDGLFTYVGPPSERMEELESRPLEERIEHPASVSIPEQELNDKVSLTGPLDRLRAGRVGAVGDFALRLQGWKVRASACAPRTRGLSGARVGLLPHQLYLANRVATMEAPRVLLADEVGLGKTIEAGLIFDALRALGRAGRVLVILPDSLVHQWLAEMVRRFNEVFRVVGPEAVREEHPLADARRVLVPWGALKAGLDREACAYEWDLLIVDEAHHLQMGQPAYETVERIAAHCRGMLLLTGTPSRGGKDTEFGLLKLVDPSRYRDFADYCAESSKWQEVSTLVRELQDLGAVFDVARHPALFARLRELVSGGLAESVRTPLDAAIANFTAVGGEEALRALLHRLVDFHGTGRVLVRNRRERLAGLFSGRVLCPVPLEQQGMVEENMLAHASTEEEEVVEAPEGVVPDAALEAGQAQGMQRLAAAIMGEQNDGLDDAVARLQALVFGGGPGVKDDDAFAASLGDADDEHASPLGDAADEHASPLGDAADGAGDEAECDEFEEDLDDWDDALDESMRFAALGGQFAASGEAEDANAHDTAHADPRTQWLADFLQANPEEKVLLIAHEKATAVALRDALRDGWGIHAGLFTEALSLVERDKQAAWFAERPGTQILLCSEIGSEGRNFQFAHHLVFWDLPLYPDVIEQRVGRLDRIGQNAPVNIHVLYFKGGREERLFEWHRQMGSFAGPIEGGDEIVREVGLARNLGTGGFTGLIQRSLDLAAQYRERARASVDCLVDLNSFDEPVGLALRNELEHLEKTSQLPAFVLQVLDRFRVNHSELSTPGIYSIEAGNMMTVDAVPGLREGGTVATFDRSIALEREDLEFLSAEHPLVSGVLSMFLDGCEGISSAVRWRGAEKEGLVLQCLFVIEAIGNKRLELQRYLSPTPFVINLALDGSVYKGPAIPADEDLHRMRPALAHALWAKVGRRLELLVQRAELVAKKVTEPLVQRAVERATRVLDGEQARLEELARLNPAVSRQEVEAHRERHALVDAALRRATPRFDAVRMVYMEP